MAPAQCLCLALTSVLLAACIPAAWSVASDEPTFAGTDPNIALAAANSTGQWRLELWAGNNAAPADPLTRIICNASLIDSCPAMPIFQDRGGRSVVVNYTLLNPRGAGGAIKTFRSLAPDTVEFRGCFGLTNTVDRAWRKKNKAYPRLSFNCPIEFGARPFNGSLGMPVDRAANSGQAVINFDNTDMTPTSTFFVMLWLKCAGQVCGFETTENPTPISGPAQYFQTKVEMGITPGMKAAATVLSIFGPVFFLCYWYADHRYYTKNGRALLLF